MKIHSRLQLDIHWRQLLRALVGRNVSIAQAAIASRAIERYFSFGRTITALSLRTIFDAVLLELALPKGSTVIMTAVNIQQMADIVRAHGLSITVVDIDPDTLAPAKGALLAAQQATNAKLCIFTQLFGGVAALEDGEQLRQRGVLVIEDAAHAFAGPYYGGSQVADISLFSFGPIKRHSALGGGVGIFQNVNFARRVQQRLDRYPLKSEVWFRQRACKYLLLKTAAIPLLYSCIMQIIRAFGQDPDRVLSGLARNFRAKDGLHGLRYGPPRRMLTLLAEQITAAVAPIARQRICQELLAALPVDARLGDRVQGNAYWLFPIQTKDPDRVVKQLRTLGFDATQGLTSLRPLIPEMTKQARMIFERIVYVPNPALLDTRTRHALKLALVEVLSQPS